MKTKILYVLTSDAEDGYAEQLLLSLLSLRRHCGEAQVYILTDRATREQLPVRGKSGETLLKLADEWIVAELDASLPKQLRSRLLKTGMRDYIDGDFLFIDSDTLIMHPLDGIDRIESPLAMCLDHHCPLRDIVIYKDLIAHCRQIGFEMSLEDSYFNSGVIYARDTPEVREFFRIWQKKYLIGRERGMKQDQPSLAWTVSERPIVARLDEVWNCQLPYGTRYMKDAIIFHYFSSGQDGSGLFYLNHPEILEKIRRDAVPDQMVDEIIDDPFKGISPQSLLVSTEDFTFFTTRRYRDLRRLYVPGRFSILEFLLKVRARLIPRR